MFKKIKKSVAVFAIVLMMSSSLNAVTTDYGNNCFGLASWVFDFVLDNGGTIMEAVTESGSALRACATIM